MTTKHTPGPWDNPTFSCAPYSVWKGDTQIASCRWVEDDSEEISSVCVQSDAEARANARLIAKAPDMYERIKQLAEDLEDGHWSNTKAELRKLVAEIDGEQA